MPDLGIAAEVMDKIRLERRAGAPARLLGDFQEKPWEQPDLSELERDAQAYCETILALPAMQEWAAAARNEPMIIDKYEF